MQTIVLLCSIGALISAWILAYHSRKKKVIQQKISLPRDYLVGLNYLLNEETDKAVDVFIKMLEVDSDTVETHLAVGKLFRRRGEVDRAIRIHQNLIARPQLDKAYREQSLFELGQDYLSAGVLDRAERIFLEILAVKEFSIPSLRALMDIYQQEKDWENAIQIAKKLEVATKKSMKSVMAQYYCELAEKAFKNNTYDQGHRYIHEALTIDPLCVRASLLHARIEMDRGKHKSALQSLHRIKEQNPDFLAEAIPPLASCYEALNEEEKFMNYLTHLFEEHPQPPIALILSEHVRRLKGEKIATDFVADYVMRHPSLSGLNLFINLYVDTVKAQPKEDLLIIQNLTHQLLAEKPAYRCSSCGFSGKSLHWQCPGCKQWTSVKPAYNEN